MLNPGIESENNKHIFMLKNPGFNLVGLFYFFVKFLVDIHGFELRVHDFAGTGYLVSRIWDTWFLEYAYIVSRAGVCSFSLPVTRRDSAITTHSVECQVTRWFLSFIQ